MVLARRVLLDALEALSDTATRSCSSGRRRSTSTLAPRRSPCLRRPRTATSRSRSSPPLRRSSPRGRNVARRIRTGEGSGVLAGRMGIPVDLMVPESMSDPGGRRGGRLPPHSKRATRRATGLEAAVVDHSPAEIAALEPGDRRSFTIEVAGPAALLVAKLHKLGDRDQDAPERLNDKDAHDVYRLLVAVGRRICRERWKCCWATISHRRRHTSPSAI